MHLRRNLLFRAEVSPKFLHICRFFDVSGVQSVLMRIWYLSDVRILNSNVCFGCVGVCCVWCAECPDVRVLS